jgi:hypothetical protein
MPALNEYLIQQPRLTRLTNHELLTLFYAHVLELARLMQASEVPQDLDPVEIARSEDRWSWSVTLPMQVEKLWADLQAVRQQPANTQFAVQTPVQLGPLLGNRYPVIRGLQPGQRVIATGLLNLRHGAPVKTAHIN